MTIRLSFFNKKLVTMADFKDSDPYQITWLIRRIFRVMSQKADKYLESLGISAAERAVIEFLYPDYHLSVPQIAEQYHVTRQHVQATVNSLKERGLVGMEANPRHARSPLITLTEKGHALFAEIAVRDEGAIKEMFRNVSDSKCSRTRKTLARVLANLTED
jgi:DNA-binding MarR family transcriptional regulator